MKTVIFAILFIGYAQCAKLDHLKYLPPDSRPANKESYDQGLDAPTSGQTQSGPQSQSTFFGKSTPFGSQPGSPGSFNAGSQNAARLQGSPFIPQGSQGTFRSSLSPSQPTQSVSVGQQTVGGPKSGTFGNVEQGTQSRDEPRQFNQPQGSDGYKASPYGGAQSTATPNYQGRSPFDNTIQGYQASVRPEHSNQPQAGTQGPQTSGTQSAGPYGTGYSRGSTFGKSTSSPTFPGATGSGTGHSQSTPFAKSSPVASTFPSQPTSGSFVTGSQPSGSFGSTFGKSTSPFGSPSGNLQSNQPFGVNVDQYQSSQPSESSTSRSFEPESKQAPASFEPSGRTSKPFSGGYSGQTQSKYQPSSLNQIPIIRLDTKNYGDGTYSHSYETGNGIQAEEQGQTFGDSSIAQGSYSYTSPEGEKVGISYTADEDGYHPQGEHLPTPPPVPEAILKSIEYNKAHPEEENEENDDGSYQESESPESSGQYKASFGKSQFSGTSRNYLAPVSNSGLKNQFSGSSSAPFNRGSTFGSPTFKSSTTGGASLPSNGPSSGQNIFSTSGYPSSPLSDKPQENTGSSIPDSVSSNYAGPSSQSNNNQQSSPTSGYQYKSPSSFGKGPSISSFGTPESARTVQGASSNQPTQSPGSQNTFSSHSGFNKPSNVAPGLKSGSFFGEGANAPQAGSSRQFNAYGSPKIASGPSIEPNNNQREYLSSETDSSSPNAPQGGSSGQFKFQSSGPSNVFTKSSNILSPTQGTASGSSRYQGPAGSPGQQNFQSTFSSGPSATKSSQFSGYEYNAPNTPFGNSGLSKSQQTGISGQKPFGSGQIQGSGSLPTGPFSSGPASTGVFGQKPFASGQTQGSGNLPNSPFSSGSAPAGVSGQKPFASAHTLGSESLINNPFSSGSALTGSPSQKPFASGHVQGPFNSGPAQIGTSGQKPFTPGQTQGPGSAPSSPFTSGSAPSKTGGEFGSGVTVGYSGPRTPGVQPQDENGGYLY